MSAHTPTCECATCLIGMVKGSTIIPTEKGLGELCAQILDDIGSVRCDSSAPTSAAPYALLRDALHLLNQHATLLAERDRAQANEKRALDDLTASEAERDALLAALRDVHEIACSQLCDTHGHIRQCQKVRAAIQKVEKT